jgi:uncharacterized membrane protein YqjE
LLAGLLDAVHTRLDIVATELEEERERLRELVVYGFWTLFFTSLGIVLITVFAALALWGSYGLYALGTLAALYLMLGAIGAARLRRSLRQRQRLFATTLAELRKDRAGLGLS